MKKLTTNSKDQVQSWYNQMMKKLFFILIVVAIIFTINHFTTPKKTDPVSEVSISRTIPSITPGSINEAVHLKKSTSLFVPYWKATVDAETYDTYDRFMYFGIGVTAEGAIAHDAGRDGIEPFLESTKGKTQLLTVRMLDTDTNLEILADESRQDSIISETLVLVNQYGFDGIVLDLELTALPLSDVTSSISVFMQRFAEEAKNNDAHFAITMYGDTYFRARPFDIKSIGTSVDEIMIMTYDFHKSRGEPGPNFPFKGRAEYGYDFETMIRDFSQDVHTDKLSVILGMYGYDWTLGPQGKPLKAANALSLNDIREIIEPTCEMQNCEVSKNESAETKVTYRDRDGYNHELWYEDEDSAQKKIKYLEEKGIGSVGYWVYGYW